MGKLDIFFDEHQGVEFDIHVTGESGGYTQKVIVRYDGLKLPVRDEQLYSSVDEAKNAARLKARGVIDQLKMIQG